MPTSSSELESLIERSVAHELRGETQLVFAPAGVCCRIEVPLAAER